MPYGNNEVLGTAKTSGELMKSIVSYDIKHKARTNAQWK